MFCKGKAVMHACMVYTRLYLRMITSHQLFHSFYSDPDLVSGFLQWKQKQIYMHDCTFLHCVDIV